MKQRLHALWSLIRQLATDDAYERYLAHQASRHPGRAPLDRRTFFIQEQQRKWSGINRCC